MPLTTERCHRISDLQYGVRNEVLNYGPALSFINITVLAFSMGANPSRDTSHSRIKLIALGRGIFVGKRDTYNRFSGISSNKLLAHKIGHTRYRRF